MTKTNNRKLLIAGNWKMNGSLELAKTIKEECPDNKDLKCEILIAPPFTLLGQVKEIFTGTDILLSGQDCHTAKSGAHTGDISAPMLKEIGCDYVILGHSERRTDHKEDSYLIYEKAQSAIEEGLKVIICIGETEAQRESGKMVEIVLEQLRTSLPNNSTWENTTIAYEPVWAIGTGKTATTEDVLQMHQAIREEISTLKGKETSDKMKILYGGSVKSSNAQDLLSLEDVDGALIGGASLKSDEFVKIITIATNL